METPPDSPTPAAPSGVSTKKVMLIILGVFLFTVLGTVGIGYWWYKHNFDPRPMQPVVLSEKEQSDLESKLAVFVDPPMQPVVIQSPAEPVLVGNLPVPQGSVPPPAVPKVEDGEENRTIIITEREVNAYLAQQNLGENVQVSFNQGKIAAGIIVEVPPDFPLFAGQKVRVKLTFGTNLTPERKLSFVFDDVSVGGISLPNAWLGDMKGVDLVEQNLQNDPALKRFLDGIQSVNIQPGSAKVVLNP